MILSDQWKDYELLDAGDGMKLERWGKYILERPDPQAIWKSEPWKGQDAIYYRSSKGGGQWRFQKTLPQSWNVSYPSLAGVLTFRVEPTGFKHTGLFPEQAANWDFLIDRIQKAAQEGYDTKILNCFAYTGGATVASAKAGANEVVHVDASKGMNKRARENLQLSGLDQAYVRILEDDVLKFTAREQRRHRKYMGIIMDPPSYGRGPGGEVWQLESELWNLLAQAIPLLDLENPFAFFILNTYTTGFAPSVSSNLFNLLLENKGSALAEEIGLPASRRPILLPCGATCRWTNDTAEASN